MAGARLPARHLSCGSPKRRQTGWRRKMQPRRRHRMSSSCLLKESSGEWHEHQSWRNLCSMTEDAEALLSRYVDGTLRIEDPLARYTRVPRKRRTVVA